MNGIKNIVQIVAVVIAIGFLCNLFIMGLFLLKVLLGLLVISLLLHWKLFPYQAHMDSKFQLIMKYVQWTITPMLNCLYFLPQFKLGRNLTFDMKVFVICSILIALLIVL